MTLATELNSLANAVGVDVKALIAKQGDLTTLSTTAKGNLVAALNELKSVLDNITGGGTPAYIDDAKETSTSDTWSIDKIKSTRASDITAAIQALETKLVAGAPGALDTLLELATALGNDSDFATTITTALASKVSFDAQTLTDPQKIQARANIGAVSQDDLTQLANDIGTVGDLVATYTAAKT